MTRLAQQLPFPNVLESRDCASRNKVPPPSAAARLRFRPIEVRQLLPKYSPDLNPIEQVFAKLKQLLRKAVPRNFEAICAAIGGILVTFAPAECANYLRNSGYSPT